MSTVPRFTWRLSLGAATMAAGVSSGIDPSVCSASDNTVKVHVNLLPLILLRFPKHHAFWAS